MTNLTNKKQLLTVAIVAVAFFLLGSMFIGGLLAMGKGKDKDEDLWKAINELQARVETLEEQTLHTLRFVEPTETIDDDPAGYETAASFVWTPKNSMNNAILSRARRFIILINGASSGGSTIREKYTSTYRWSALYSHRDFWDQEVRIPVNQESYTFEFKFNIVESPASIRNVNIILEVIDGLPAEPS